MKRWYFILLLTCALALVAGAGFWGFRSSAAQANPNIEAPTTVAATTCDVQQSVTAPGNLANQHQVNLQMPADGSLQEILVRPGDHVQEGQVLARLSDREQFAAAVAAARLELLQAQHDLEQLGVDAPVDAAQAHLAVVEAQDAVDKAQRDRQRLDHPRANETTIATARAHLEITEGALKAAKKAYKRVASRPAEDPERARALAEMEEAQRAYDMARGTLGWYEGHATEQEIAEADAQLALAQTQLEQTEKEWERLKDGLDPLSLDLAQAEIDDAQAKLDEAERNLEAVEIKAPFDGVVLEVGANPGETLAAHSPLIVLSDPRQVEIKATVTEEDFPLLKPGQSVQVYFTARPDVIAQGKVDRIVPKLVEGSSPTYEIFIRLDQVPEGLVDGMTVDANVTIASRTGVLCLPRSVVHASADNKAILQVWNGVQAESRQVTIGLRGDSDVEILSGLKEGEQVVVR